jgi:hypothetical protein
MSVKLTITQLGTPKALQTSKGPAEKNWLKATEFGDTYLNFWVNNTTRNWKAGDVVEVETVEKRDYTAKDGTLKVSHDIKLPRFGGGNVEVTKALEEIRNTQVRHGLLLQEIVNKLSTKAPDDYPSFEGEPNFDPKDEPVDDEVPF